MTPEKRTARARQIERSAYEILDKKGFAGLSMQAVAKNAKASNETLYRWYGDKIGLFEALIRGNTETVIAAFDDAQGTTPLDRLETIGARLLKMLLGPRAVALNRAAAADASGKLGATLSREGRKAVAPRVAALLQDAIEAQQLGQGERDQMAEMYFGLLIGDQQLRRVTGAMPEPGLSAIETRAAQAVVLLRRVFPPG